MYKFGDVIISYVQFIDTFEIKIRPALVLFEENGNIVVAGITSNIRMPGIPLTCEEGAVKDSIIKLNYIFTISERMVKKHVFSISEKKKTIIRTELLKKIE